VDIVRMTDFYERIETQFGRIRGDSILVDHVITSLGGLTGAQAIEAGVDPKEVWRALCAEFDVPKSVW
jgi:hypothetical protein